VHYCNRETNAIPTINTTSLVFHEFLRLNCGLFIELNRKGQRN